MLFPFICPTGVRILDLKDFGLLVKALRKSSFDEHGNRWTREALSKAVHLTEDQLGRLERGDRKYLDNQTLMHLADSFNLTSMERKEFFYAALGLKDEELFNPEDPEIQFTNLLEIMEQLLAPAFLTDVYKDIIVANKAVIDLYQFTPTRIKQLKNTPAGYNQLYLIYSSKSGIRKLVGPLWREAAMMTLLEFRRSTLRYRHKNYFQYLINNLLKLKDFELDWSSSHRLVKYNDTTYEHFGYEHSFFGPVAYTATETTINTSKGELTLVLYNPADPVTVSVFEEIMKFGGNKTLQMAAWLEK